MVELSYVERKIRAHRDLPPPAFRRALRESAGLSQEDVAQAVGVRRESVSRWETGIRAPRGQLLVAYTEVLEAIIAARGAV
jgi:transcriptional regulator with XRE-family HTH domain